MTTPTPPPVQLVSLPQLARLKGVPYRTLYGDIVALWERDVAEGAGEWLHRLGRRKKIWVNLSRLRMAHPVLFAQHYVARDEFEEQSARIANLEAALKDAKQRLNAVAAGLRDIRNEKKPCEGMPSHAGKNHDL